MTENVDMPPDIKLVIRTFDGDTRSVLLSGHGNKYLIGRAVTNAVKAADVTFDDMHASRRHCELFRHGGGDTWMIRDLLSSNGTRVDGEMVGDLPMQLRDGARIAVGRTVLAISFGRFPDALMPASEMKAVAPDLTFVPGTPGDGTLVFGAGGQVKQPPSDKSTVNAASLDLTFVPGTPGDGTLVFGAGGQVKQPPSDKSTVNAGAIATADECSATQHGLLQRPNRIRITEGMEEENSTVALRHDLWKSSSPGAVVPDQPSYPQQVGQPVSGGATSASIEAEQSEADRVGLRGIAAEFVNARLLDPLKALALMKVAREKGRTFFRELALDGSVKFKSEIYRLATRYLGIELIENENVLMERAMESKEIPYALAANLGAVLLQHVSDKAVLYATIDPFDVTINDWISNTFHKPTQRVAVLPNHFHAALQRLKTHIEDDESGTNLLLINLDVETERQINARIETVEVPQVVNYFLQKSHSEKASDIHIEPTEEYLLVRNRVDGILHEMISLPINMHPEIVSRIKILSGMDVAEKRRPQDGRIATIIRDHPIDVRVSIFPTIYGEKVVMRLLDKNALQETPSTLGLVDRDLRRLYEKLEAPYGLVMISGPTGSGKTTSLYSCLSYIDKKTKNVLTVEDPVEYRLKGVHQMQVNEKIGLTFASGLRTILRQDPDIIMVGECRDAETAGMAIQAALTGHIVFSTIHTNDAIGVVTRMLDMGVDAFLVANALTLCIGQRLIRKICGHCQVPIEGAVVLERLADDGITSDRLADLGIDIDAELNYVVGAGCMHCRNTGYQGRRAVFEVFEVTQEARSMIVSPNFNADELRKRARESGMTRLIGHGLILVDEGITTHAEVLRVLGESY
ncbi:MAG: ATPase, T2SS/T4P/T4SS family [Rhodospirillaceae bacterium]